MKGIFEPIVKPIVQIKVEGNKQWHDYCHENLTSEQMESLLKLKSSGFYSEHNSVSSQNSSIYSKGNVSAGYL